VQHTVAPAIVHGGRLTQTVAAANMQDPSGAWLTSDGEWRFLTWDQEIFASRDFVAWQRLGQPAGLPVGDCPSLFPLPAAVDGAGPLPAAAPTHVHKISYDSRDFYTIG
jgi:hypothetical protein